jgi:hypothetical protein
MINAHRLRPQVSSPELRNTSQPPPYPYRTTPVPSPRRNPRPQGQVYFDQIVDPGHTRLIHQQLPLSLENLPTRPERCFSTSSPSSYSSSCMSMGDNISTRACSLPSTPSFFSQESFPPARALSWVAFPEAHHDSDSDSDGPSPLFNPSGHNKLTIIPDHKTRKLTIARPRHQSGAGGRFDSSGQNNRRLIVVDDNLVGRDSEVSSESFEAHTLRQAEVTRLVREKPSHVGNKNNRDAVFKVTCSETSELWKIPVVPREALKARSNRGRVGVQYFL